LAGAARLSAARLSITVGGAGEMPKISGTSIFRITMYYIMRMIDRVGFGRVINSFGTFKPPPRRLISIYRRRRRRGGYSLRGAHKEFRDEYCGIPRGGGFGGLPSEWYIAASPAVIKGVLSRGTDCPALTRCSLLSLPCRLASPRKLGASAPIDGSESAQRAAISR